MNQLIIFVRFMLIHINIRWFVFSCILLFFVRQLPAQGLEYIDSLKNELHLISSDSQHVKLLNEISYQYKKVNPDSAEDYARLALKVSEEKQYKEGKAVALKNLGNVYSNKGAYEDALEYYFRALEIVEKLDNKLEIAWLHSNIGVTYRRISRYELAIEHYIKSLQLAEELNDKPIISMVNNNIGNIYFSQEYYEKALEYYLKSLEIKKELADREGIATSQNNIASLYVRLKKYDQALEFAMNALKIKKEINDKSGISVAYMTISDIYTKQQNYNEAIEYAFLALKIKESLNDKYGIVNARNGLGEILIIQQSYDEAILNLKKSLAIAQEIGANELIKSCYQHLANAYKGKKNYQEALIYYESYVDLRDAIVNDKNSEKIAEIQSRYLQEKKDKEIMMQQVEIEKAHAETRKLFLGLAVIIILMGVMVFAYNQKRKSNKIVAEQKRQVEIKNKEINESITYAKKIQEAILPDQSILKKIFPDSFIFYNPKDIVSGDFYWFEQKDDKLFLAAADCTGHGVPGAFMSLICSVALRRAVNSFGNLGPGEILKRINTEIKMALKQDSKDAESKDGMDIVLCKIDKKNEILEYAGAHRPLYYFTNGIFNEIKGSKFPIGGNQHVDEVFTGHVLDLKTIDSFYLTSDGYADQFGGDKEKKFSVRRFKNLLNNIYMKSVDEQIQVIKKSFYAWKEKNEQTDDVLVIGIKTT